MCVLSMLEYDFLSTDIYIPHKNPEFENVDRKTTGHAIQLFSSYCDQATI